MTIISIFKIPKIIADEKHEIIRLRHFIQIEGLIGNYNIEEHNGKYFESFCINDINFKYSVNIIIDGFHQTSRKMDLLKKNGQNFKISYIKRDSLNLILRIETKAP